ncbi:MAG: KH domain-containing protein [Rubrobacteraceae bacterium]
MQQLEDLVRFLTKSLVDDPDQVEVSGTEDDSRVGLQIKVAQEDIGKVIGRQGRTIKAIRTLTKAASVKAGKRVNIEVQD